MIKKFWGFVVVLCTLAALSVLFPGATTAHAATKPSCAVTDVTLHGTAAPTVTCQATTMMVHPDTEVVPQCWSKSYLELYWNGPVNARPNYVLCVNGDGVLNLNQQLQTSPDYDYRNWNDQASAWWTGCEDVTFYKDINQKGASVTEPGSAYGQNSPQGIFPLGGIGNDQLSSVWLHPATLC